MIANIAMNSPTMQITVPLKVIAEFMNPVISFTTAKTLNTEHITNAILDTIA